ncbi:hypothetical protein G647_00356 [Cladophialophora carrionii CBS 160.54]|uniref:Uncharacterized protein n=1 Tax=Cladophialophora carrionii CBS 160.54 TaxID=1279043 RepID=V9DPN6_9EURO|nr:uncharacterized protein G647_00356 [Cladophialophora carrionii CBS 160.54]ETI27907.1 hypothetical protein G647_00356 [Cladophialophora carrionii CBS 160.54]
MADEAGFPWQAPSRDPEKEAVVTAEQQVNNVRPDGMKGQEAPASPVKITTAQQNIQPRKHNNSLHGRPHSGSVKGPPRVNHSILTAPSDPITSKPTSPLPVRTIPPWVRDAEEGDLDDPQFLVPDAPHSALVAQHHYSPSTSRRPLLGDQQHHADGLCTPSTRAKPTQTSRWMSFAQPSAYAQENFDSEKVDQEWLNQNMTDYSKAWLADHDDDDVEDSSSRYRAFRRKRKVWYKRAQFTVLRNPFIPLIFRMIVLVFAIAAMALGASIYHETGKITRCISQPPGQRNPDCIERVGATATDYYRDPSGLMAIIVDAIAIVYTVYITYDEYFSKPLGLRPARAKVRLVLLDLFFVVFQSANLALSFESLTVDEGACKAPTQPTTAGRFDKVCDRAESLSSVLLVSLTAWLLTFSVSVLRLVERIDTK